MTVRLPIAACEGLEAAGVGGRLRHVELEIAGRRDMRRAEIADASGIGGRLRQAEIEAAQQRGDHAGDAPPTFEGPLGEPPVDEDQGHAAPGAGHDQVGPEIGLDEEREIGPPMIEEAPHETRRVERHELVDHALRQALLGEIGRGDGARGAQHLEVLLADALDQRDHRQQFADAGAVHPDQRARRTRDLALAVALAQARRMLLAALEPVRDERRRKRRSRPRQQAIGVQRERQPLRHHCALPPGRSAMA